MSGNIEDLRRNATHRKTLSLENIKLGPVPVRKWKSLPIVNFSLDGGRVSQGVAVKKGFGGRPKILRKTWDRVRGILPGGRGSDVGGGSSRGGGSCSAPSTPLKGDGFFGDDGGGGGDERDRIARNYALLQKRLSQEFRQSSLKGKGTLRGEFSDEFKRKLFEWEKSHPRKGKRDGREVPSGLSTRHLKELAWLDKQLEKIEAEKRRLEEELKRQVEREVRVQKMKEAITRCNVNDRFLIRTESGAKVRVEGITSEYAMKVYEWEEKRGIGVEMSALGYFDPKYRDVGDQEAESGVVEGKEEEKDEEVVGPLDLINERLRLKEDDEEEDVGKRGVKLLAECVALGEIACGGGGSGVHQDGDGRISSTASSCCCSAEYECEHTDSFATKNNSGASNTDSDVYDKRCTITRRRSSELSTPDRASPGLSAFTSEEDEESKEEEKKVVSTCVKQIVIEEPEGGFDGSNVFVKTKRTIFKPVDGDEGVKIVGVVAKNRSVEYKPQPKTQLHRVFPCSAPVYASPMAARRSVGVDGFGRGRRVGLRTNVRVPYKYTLGGGIAPFGRGVIARSSSFNGERDDREVTCDGGGVVDGGEFVGVSKSKSTGSIKRSIKCFLGFGKGSSRTDVRTGDGDSVQGERRGSKEGKGGLFSKLGFWSRGRDGD